ncbi:MAG: MerR family transcriptional regulator [Hyphomonadaceae bacterium]|nr:MerR family transcriptional regulator [Hyphomonadaceae bacterium]
MLKPLEEQAMALGFSIGEAARRSGCSVATIRYYEEIGLIAKAARSAAGRREFTRPDIERLRLIRRLRSMEFGVESIRDLLNAMSGAHTCLDVRDIAAAQLGIVQARRREIDALERALAGLAGRCSSLCADGPNAECTIVGELTAA